VPFLYDAPATGALRQGEIVGPLWIHRPDTPAAPLDPENPPEVASEEHTYMLVLHADCDLEQDFSARDAATGLPVAGAQPARLLPGIIICDLFVEAEIRDRAPPGSEAFRRISQNQNERFHKFPASVIGAGPANLPELFIDFKRTYMEMPEAVYPAIASGSIQRVAIVPSIYLHDLMHRFFGFQSRIALPD
jgi:hypothetical protein